MKLGDKIFVIVSEKIVVGTIRNWISHQGVLTGYEIDSKELPSSPMSTKFSKQDVFADEEAATKALFIRKLKKEEESKRPAEDIKGDRHWIQGYSSRRRPRQ